MPTIFEYGGPQVDLLDVRVATNDLDGTFGTAVDIPGAQMASVKLNVSNVEATGDGEVVATYTRVRSADMRLRNVSIPTSAYSIIFGTAGYEYSTTPTRRTVTRYGPRNFPYFAIAWKTAAADSGRGVPTGCTIVFAPKCKAMEAPNLEFSYETILAPESSIRALPDDYYLDEQGEGTIFEIITYETAVSVTIPPVSYS